MKRCVCSVASVDPELPVRFTSPHPKDFGADCLAAIAAHPNICRHLHMPAQSGSTANLAPHAARLHARRVRCARVARAGRAARRRAVDRHYSRILRRDGGRTRRNARLTRAHALRARLSICVQPPREDARGAALRGRRTGDREGAAAAGGAGDIRARCAGAAARPSSARGSWCARSDF